MHLNYAALKEDIKYNRISFNSYICKFMLRESLRAS